MGGVAGCSAAEYLLFCQAADSRFHYLTHPVNSSGTAILKEGQYKGAYQLDIHNRGLDSGHLALCQRLKPVTVYRDSNRDSKLNLLEGKTQTGMFNIHRTSEDYIQRQRFSAGCQVFAEQRQFAEFIRACQASEKAFGNKFHLHPAARARFLRKLAKKCCLSAQY